jgi:hypothetical protein
MLSATFFCYAEYNNAEFPYAECDYAERHGAVLTEF